MPVAVYLRVSTEEQRERQSIHTQRDFAQRYTDLHQLSVYRTYADDGVSGTVALHSRPAGQQLLDDAHRHRFDQLLVFKLDRLGRDTRLTLETKFLHLRHPAPLGQSLDDGWRVCWLGGWDKHRFFFVVMVVRQHETGARSAARTPRPRPPLCR